MSVGNAGIALMYLAERREDAAMAEAALSQINTTFEAMRERRQGPYAAHFEQQLPIARDSRGYAGCELPTESLPIGSHRLFSSDDGREIGRTIFGTPSRPATGLRFCPRVGRHGSLRAENGLNGKGGFKEGASLRLADFRELSRAPAGSVLTWIDQEKRDAGLTARRSSNGTDRRAIHGGCMPVRPRRTAQGGDYWTMAGRQLSPYRSRASPRLKLPALTKFALSSGCRARAGGSIFERKTVP
jgi:hypothetical protein